ncbi:ATP-dependent RNA helicase DDX24-like [Pocillopora verrucosa]|uniref:ATP-dependent RNA helicase DDX24-like n=1 Tax=Pocillopora verrucosa TaxID=203993 RepID=UPI00333E8793
MEDYDLKELTGIGTSGPARKKKIKERPPQKTKHQLGTHLKEHQKAAFFCKKENSALLEQDNQEQTDTTPLTQLEKSTKNDQQTKGKKKRKKKNKAQSKAQSEEQNRVEMVTDNRLEEDPPEPTADVSAWEVLGVPKEVQRGLSEQSFTTPTPIQTLSLPPAIFHHRDIIGAAETGSGKTLAFGIPILTHILGQKTSQEAGETTENATNNNATEATETGTGTSKLKKPLLALIMTPTRELAIQIKNHLKQAAKHTSLEIVAVVGGMAPQKQQRLLNKYPEIIVATPGRLWDLISEGEEHVCRLEHLRYLVIDEADRMVEQGHFQELSSILELIHRKSDNDEDEGTAKRRHLQKFIFSATLTLPKSFKRKGKEKKITSEEGLVSLMDKVGLQKNSCKIINVTNKRGTVETLTEAKISCAIEEKDLYLYYFLSRYPGRTLVFSNTVDCVRRLGSLFRLLDFDPWVLHASMQQRQRLKNLDRFKQSASGLLLATDVAARGLDIPAVEHVIHYQVPKDPDLYIHRSGRTARASREGLSVVLVGPEEMGSYKKIMKALNGGNELDSFPVDVSFMSSIRKIISLAKQIDKEEHKFRRKKSSNDWILASAKAMDIEVDEDLLEDLEDQGERKERQVKLKQLKVELTGLLKTPLIPAGFSGKYPTKTGSLMMPGIKGSTSSILSSAGQISIPRQMLGIAKVFYDMFDKRHPK